MLIPLTSMPNVNARVHPIPTPGIPSIATMADSCSPIPPRLTGMKASVLTTACKRKKNKKEIFVFVAGESARKIKYHCAPTNTHPAMLISSAFTNSDFNLDVDA